MEYRCAFPLDHFEMPDWLYETPVIHAIKKSPNVYVMQTVMCTFDCFLSRGCLSSCGLSDRIGLSLKQL